MTDLYWNFLAGVPTPMYIATESPKTIGDEIKFIDSIGYIEKTSSGSWSAFLGNGVFLGSAPNKIHAMQLVEKRQIKFAQADPRDGAGSPSPPAPPHRLCNSLTTRGGTGRAQQ